MITLLRELRKFADTAVCPVADHCVSGFVSGAYTGWGWARERVAKFAKDFDVGYPEEALVVFKDGTHYCAVKQNFKNLQESPAGFGVTADQAIEALEKAA